MSNSRAPPFESKGKQWTEKYRPPTLADVKGQDAVVKALSTKEDLPHLLFHGPAGTGKTSTILAFLRERYPRDWGHRTLILNASDERGINVVREKVKEFVKVRASYHRYVILDEADSLTMDAQSALRRIIEGSEGASFCLICNYRARLIPPLQSRCFVYQFEPLPVETTVATLKEIGEREGFVIEDDAAIYLSENTNGDLRQAITILQNSIVGEEPITLQTLHWTMDHIPDDLLKEISDRVLDALSLTEMREIWHRVEKEGFDLVRLLNRWADYLVTTEEDFPFVLINGISRMLHQISLGASPYLQFINLNCNQL